MSSNLARGTREITMRPVVLRDGRFFVKKEGTPLTCAPHPASSLENKFRPALSRGRLLVVTAGMLVALGLVPKGAAQTLAGDQDAPRVSRLWERAVSDRTESLQVFSGTSLVRIGTRTIDGFEAATGAPTWTVARDGAAAVQVWEVAGAPYVALLRRFDRPPPASGLIEGTSYCLHVVKSETGTLVWNTGIVSGDCQYAEAYPEQDRLIAVLRSDEGTCTIAAFTLSAGGRLWEIELGDIEALGFGESLQASRYYGVAGDRLFRVDRRERTISVSAHDLRSGDLRWVSYLEGEQKDVVLSPHDDILYAIGRNFCCIDPRTGAVQWVLRGAWLPVEERTPWLFVCRADGSRIQLVHRNTGEERWRSTPRTRDPLVIIWTPAGVLVGESRGRTALWAVVDGKRIARQGTRYRAPSRNDFEDAFPLSDGMLFVLTGARGSEILRVGQTGDTRWRAEIEAPPRMLVADIVERWGGEPLVLAGADADRDPESVWVVSTVGGQAGLRRVDLATGAGVEEVSIDPANPVFAADRMSHRLFFIDPYGKLVAVEH